MPSAITTKQFDHARLEILDPADCPRLLKTVPLGRLVYTYAGLPAIRCSTGPGDKFRAAERGDAVAFESDNAELDRRLGWTVVLDAVSVTHLRYRVLS